MIIIALALILPISAKWQHYPQIATRKIPSQQIDNIEISLKEEKVMSFSDVVGFQLYQKSGIDDFTNLNSFKQIENSQEQYDIDSQSEGCSFQHRAVSLSTKLSIRLPQLANTYFNDMVVFEEFSRAYIVRNDLKIYTMLFEQGVEKTVIKIEQFNFFDDFFNLIQKTTEKYFNPLMCRVNKIIYIFTHLGGVRFSANNDQIKGYNQLQFVPFNLNHQEQIKQVLYNPTLIQTYILMKKQIAVYSMNQVDPIFQYFITLNNTELLSIRLHEKEQILFVLTNNGINLINVNQNNFIIQDFQIPMDNSIQFNYVKNTFIVIAQTPQQISFGVEINWDQGTNDYYYNKFYLQDMQLSDVYLKDKIGLLVGGEAHSIIFPNGFRDNTDTNSNFPLYTEEILLANLQKIELSDMNNSQYNAYALSQNIFETFTLQEKPASIVCFSEIETQQSYWAFWNLTSCASNSFEVCQIEQKITLKTYRPLITSDNQTEIMAISVGVGLIILILIIAALVVYKKWNKIIKAIESQKLKKQYADMQEVQEK